MIDFELPEGAREEYGGFSDAELDRFLIDPKAFSKAHPAKYEKLQNLVGPRARIITAQQRELLSKILSVNFIQFGTDLRGHIQYPDDK